MSGNIAVNAFPLPLDRIPATFFGHRLPWPDRVHLVGCLAVEELHRSTHPLLLGGNNAEMMRSEGLAGETGVEGIHVLFA
jgi:hypothetical protein